MEKTTRKDLAIILGTILLALLSLALLGNLTIDSSTDAFMPTNSPVIAVNREIERQFGSMDALVIGISVPDGSILNPFSLELIDLLTQRISRLDSIDTVTSITNTDHMQAGTEGFEAVPLYAGTSPQQLDELASRLSEWPGIYDGNLVSADRSMATIIIQTTAGTGQQELGNLLDELGDLVDSVEHGQESFSIIGLPVVKQQINRSLMSDMSILVPIVGLLIILVLFFSFRRVAGIFLPLIGLVLSASIAIGIMAILDITFTMATMLVPVLLLIVGSAYAIHVMSHFYEEVALLNRNLGPSETRIVIGEVLHRNRLPIIMAGATTAAGFIAQFTSPLAPFRTFGLLSAIGVVLSQLSSLYLLPAMLRITYRNGIDPIKLHTQRDMQREFKGHPILGLFERIATKGGIPLTVISLVLAGTTIAMIPTIRTGTNMLDFFQPTSAVVRDTKKFNETMGGSGILTVMVDGKEASSILDPNFLRTLDSFANTMETVDGVGKVQTIIPYIKRMNLLMNQDSSPYALPSQQQSDFDFFSGTFGVPGKEEPELRSDTAAEAMAWDARTYDEIPTEPAKYGLETNGDLQNLISQYLLLYSGNLGSFINDSLEPSATLVTIQLQKSDTNTLRKVHSAVTTFWDTNLPAGWEYALGGGEAISLALTDLITRSQIYSLAGALLIVWLLVSVLFRSPLAGLIALIPVAFALMGIFVFMALLGINLDVITSLLAALAIGIGVDYAIHFLSACKRLSCSTGPNKGLGIVMRTTGRAIVINAASVTIGFSGLLFSRFIPIQQMGILFCVSMVFAGLSSLTVLPMVLNRWQPKFLLERSAPATQVGPDDLPERRISP